MLTNICDRLGLDVPIFAFSHCRDVVAAVTNAGGIGVLGATTLSPAALEIDLTWIDNETKGKPYGVDLLLPMTFARPLADDSGATTATSFPLEQLGDEGLLLDRKRRRDRGLAAVVERTGERHGQQQVDSVWLAFCLLVDPGEVNLQRSWAERGRT